MAIELDIRNTDFTLNGRLTFLYGISYYGVLGATDEATAAEECAPAEALRGLAAAAEHVPADQASGSQR